MMNKTKRMDKQEIEGLLFNAQNGDAFVALRQSEANDFQKIAFANGMGIVIEVEDAAKRTYRATVKF